MHHLAPVTVLVEEARERGACHAGERQFLRHFVLCEELLSQQLFCRHPVARVDLQHLPNDPFCRLRKSRLAQVVSSLALQLQSLMIPCFFTLKGKPPAQKKERHDPQRPNVHLLTIPIRRSDLRRHVVRSPALSLSPFASFQRSRKTKIPQPQLHMFSNETVLKFQVTMHQPLSVQIHQRFDELFEEVAGFHFLQGFPSL